MGEIADMILDGILCEQCGTYIAEGEAEGFPRSCNSCKRETVKAKVPKPKVPCPQCKKLVKAAGLQDHMRAVHPGSKS